jgi:spore germination cell wall hydrolase CwlJ-like protein
MPTDADMLHELDVVARTIWGEASGEGMEGMAAVANVIANRVARPRWWGKGWVGVCQKKYQFSCWLVGDPVRKKMLTVTTTNMRFRDALILARAAIAGELGDRTRGADHYYADYIATPKWAQGQTPTVVIGRHRFFKLEK